MRLLPHIRLSDLTDETTSPERQTKEITGYARNEDTFVTWDAVDLDVSGSVSPFEREHLGPWLTNPGLIAQWDAIIVVKMDRLSRNLFYFLELCRWCEAHGKAIISVQERLDFSTPQGRAFIQMLAVFAEFERGMIAERVKQATAALHQAGQYAGGQVPFGYMPVRLDTKGWGFVLDHEYAPVVRKMVSNFLEGWSLNRIAEWLNAHAVPTSRNVVRRRQNERAAMEGRPLKMERPSRWRATTVAKVLGSPTITGVMVSGGEILRDGDGMPIPRAEPIVDHETYLKIRARLDANSDKTGPRVNSSPMLRIAFCGQCGSVMYTSKSGTYSYYECGNNKARKGTCIEKKIRAEIVDELLEDVLMDAVGDLPMRTKIVHPVTDHSAELHQVEQAIKSLEDAFVGSGMSADRFTATMARLEARQAALSSTETAPERIEWQETGQTFREHWRALEDRNAFLRDAGIKLLIHHGDEDEDVWPIPDPTGRVVRLVGNGLWAEVHLGDVAELRELAGAQG